MANILAFYLPQFHEIPENSAWWGSGFTDWVNVRKAQPLYPFQRQPRVPLQERYYDLSDVKSLEWQADIAKKFGVSGFCMYHYWFKGRKLLEKPAELLLANPDVDANFCFCWANEPWARTWDGRDTDVLMAQSYGGVEEWDEHFEYLLPFFLDARYVKKQGMPVFLIYNVSTIPDVDGMIDRWQFLARERGLGGLHIVECLNGKNTSQSSSSSDALAEFEPNFSMSSAELPFLSRVKRFIRYRLLKKPHLYSYKEIYNKIISRDLSKYSKKVYRGLFVDWDNTPRKGTRGVVYHGSSPSAFEDFSKRVLSKLSDEDLVFVNAWNEWAEGTYLEPDEHYQYGYLEALRNANEKR